MCTAIIATTLRPRGYMVLFNRDEMRSRGVALAPSIQHRPGGPTFMAPTDPDAGGSWLAATACGEVFCILNRYEDSAAFSPQAPVTSRGHVIAWMTGRGSEETPAEVFASKRDVLAHVRPFRLVYVDPSATVTAWSWTGRDLKTEVLALPALLVSAGQKQADVARARRQRLADDLEGAAGWGALATRLAWHDGVAPLAQTCLHLPHVATVSQTVVTVAPRDVTMHYKGGSPCSWRTWHSTRLARDS